MRPLVHAWSEAARDQRFGMASMPGVTPGTIFQVVCSVRMPAARFLGRVGLLNLIRQPTRWGDEGASVRKTDV